MRAFLGQVPQAQLLIKYLTHNYHAFKHKLKHTLEHPTLKTCIKEEVYTAMTIFVAIKCSCNFSQFPFGLGCNKGLSVALL